MKKLIYALPLFFCAVSFGQTKITDMTTYIGNPSGGWVPVVIAGANRKVDAFYFAANKVDTSKYRIDSLATASLLALKVGTAKYATDSAANATAVAAKVKYTDTAAMLSPYLNNVILLSSGLLHTSPSTTSITSHGATITQTLANQSPYTVLGRGSGTGVPSFLASLDSNWIPQLNNKLNKSDTSAMLLTYAQKNKVKQDSIDLQAAIAAANYWTVSGPDIYRNSKVTIGQTTIGDSALYVANGIHAKGGAYVEGNLQVVNVLKSKQFILGTGSYGDLGLTSIVGGQSNISCYHSLQLEGTYAANTTGITPSDVGGPDDYNVIVVPGAITTPPVSFAIKEASGQSNDAFQVIAGNSTIVINGITKDGKEYFQATNTATGTTTAQTINKPTGTINIAASGTSATVTNSLVTTTSIVYCVVRTNDATAYIKNVVPAAGSFTVTLGAAATAEVSVGFIVFN